MNQSLARRPLKLGFLSPHNPHDRRAFSGTVSFAARALAEHPGVDLTLLGGFTPPRPILDRLRKPSHEIDVARLDVGGLDAVVGLVATPLLDELGRRRPDLPLVHVTDATPRFLRDAYGWQVPPEADTLERRLAARATATVYSSEAIAARAPGDLGLPALTSTVIPFGVNLDDLPDFCPEPPDFQSLNLIFVGNDWVRKGGEIAIAALDTLRATGRRAHLTIIGTCPERHRKRTDVTYLGYLDKNRPRDAARIAQAYRAAHLLVLPSRADCTPMVVGEAMALGTPVLATDTGGIGTMLRASGGGRTLPQFTTPRDWATAIAEMTDTPDTHAFYADAGFDHMRSKGSWTSWARRLHCLVRNRLMHAEPLERQNSAA